MTSKDEDQTNPSKYKMDHAKRGIALVINIDKYDEQNPHKNKAREWSKIDVENLTKTLKYLEFAVKIVENLKKSKIVECLNQIATEIDHSDFECFLCVAMSHGNKDEIVTRDNKLISFEEIMTPIKSCPTLMNKPKMFFFQACRGENKIQSRASSAHSIKSNRGEPMSDTSQLSNLQSNVNKSIERKLDGLTASSLKL
jgi:hypothetical protein